MAIAAFKTQIFNSAFDLQVFVSTDAGVSTVVSIVCDNSGKFVLFYT
jgi:hypothetical protein